jgi:hypothetical protein
MKLRAKFRKCKLSISSFSNYGENLSKLGPFLHVGNIFSVLQKVLASSDNRRSVKQPNQPV